MRWLLAIAVLLTATTCEKKMAENNSNETEETANTIVRVSSLSEEGYVFRFVDKQCIEVTGRSVSAEDFLRYTEESGWERLENHIIMKDGSLGDEKMTFPSLWPAFFYFENGTIRDDMFHISGPIPYRFQDSVLTYRYSRPVDETSLVLNINEEYMDVLNYFCGDYQVTRMKKVSKEEALQYIEKNEEFWENYPFKD